MTPAHPAPNPFTAFVPYFPVQDLAATRDFYERELGLELAREDPTCVLFRAGTTLLGFRPCEGGAPDPGEVLLTLACSDVDAVYRRLRRLGVETERPPGTSERAGLTHFLARDPDGYRVEVRLPGGSEGR